MNLFALRKAIREKNEPEITLCTYCSEPSHEGDCIDPTIEGIQFYFSIGKYYVEETEPLIKESE